jgi:hypothetical protein
MRDNINARIPVNGAYGTQLIDCDPYTQIAHLQYPPCYVSRPEPPVSLEPIVPDMWTNMKSWCETWGEKCGCVFLGYIVAHWKHVC